jgi:hypothetical protein
MQINTANDALNGLAGGTFVGLDTQTLVKLKGGKKNPMQGRVTKRTTGATVMCFSNTNGSAYGAMVKRRLEQEGKDPASFELGPRAWGERIEGTSFVQHNGKHYLEVIFLRAGKTEFFLDGAAIQRHEIEGLDEPKESTGQGGLENQVIIRTFALDSVTALRTNGREWR